MRTPAARLGDLQPSRLSVDAVAAVAVRALLVPRALAPGPLVATDPEVAALPTGRFGTGRAMPVRQMGEAP